MSITCLKYFTWCRHNASIRKSTYTSFSVEHSNNCNLNEWTIATTFQTTNCETSGTNWRNINNPDRWNIHGRSNSLWTCQPAFESDNSEIFTFWGNGRQFVFLETFFKCHHHYLLFRCIRQLCRDSSIINNLEILPVHVLLEQNYLRNFEWLNLLNRCGQLMTNSILTWSRH